MEGSSEFDDALERNDGMTSFDCGCAMTNVGDTCVFKPCSPTCDTYAYAIEEMRKTGKEFHGTIDVSESGQITDYLALCPFCEAQVDGYSGASGSKPSPNAVGICAYCGHYIVFEVDHIRKPTKREERMYNNDPQARTLHAMINRKLLPHPDKRTS